MTFAAALKTVAHETEALLERLLPDATAPAPRLAEAMRYAVLGQGKRLRPFFLVESARVCGAGRANALHAAAALECIHCYSLVHDDLPAMDNDDLRRGRPTVHKAYDEATAILAGDSLLTLAFELIASPATHPDPGIRTELSVALARASGAAGMAGGQMLDIAAEESATLSLEQIIQLQSYKTGALFRFACEAGAILGRAPENERRALRSYADRVGLAFQIADDVLDVEFDAEALGKATGKDKGRGKATFVGLLGLSGAKERARALVCEAQGALQVFGPEGSSLSEAADFIVTRRS